LPLVSSILSFIDIKVSDVAIKVDKQCAIIRFSWTKKLCANKIHSSIWWQMFYKTNNTCLV